MKARQDSWESSSWARTFLSRGCLRGSRVQLHRRSFPLDLEIITLLRVLLGGGLRATGSTHSCQQAVRDGKKITTEEAEDSPEVVVRKLLQCVGLCLVLLLIKAHVGQIDGLSPLIRRHGHQCLTRRETVSSEGTSTWKPKVQAN